MSEKLNLSNLKITKSQERAEEILSNHIGFKKEKDSILKQIAFYIIFKGNFRPHGKVICYSGAPGTGKTTFVKTVAEAMDRPLIIISCAGFENNAEFSILGDQNKPGLVAWTIKKSECSNPIILFDELEKVKNEKFQGQLIEILKKIEQGESFFDPFFKKEINLSHITFFATVNYKEKLATKLKGKVFMKELPDYTNEEKIKILRTKRNIIQEKYKLTESEAQKILSDETLEFLINWIQEKGIRKSEQALYKIVEEYIFKKIKKQSFQEGSKWIKENISPYQESFKLSRRHHFLFASFIINLALLIFLIFKKITFQEEKAEVDK